MPEFPVPEVPSNWGVEQPKAEPLPPFEHPVYEPPAQPTLQNIPAPLKPLPTVRIYTPDGLGSCIIDSASFNPHCHRLFSL